MSKRLLLALGNVSVAEEYAIQLTRKGFVVDVVHDGNAALEHLMASVEPPNAILLGVELPGENGFKVFEEMKAGLMPTGTPVIFLSATGSASDFEHCNALGATKCIAMIRSTAEDVAKEAEDAISGVVHPLDVGSVPRSEVEKHEAALEPQDTKTDLLLDGESLVPNS